MSSNAPSSQEATTSDPSSASSSVAQDDISINIKAPGDTKLALSISLSKTVLDLKKLISEKTEPRIESDSQRCESYIFLRLICA